MLDSARRLACAYEMFLPGSTVLCGVSGGADSMCLLHWLYHDYNKSGISVLAAHFNHGLRGENSNQDAQFVQEWCATHGIPFFLGGADVAAEAKARKQGLEETARTLRYAFLHETAQKNGASVLAVAHNADDNAETILLHLVRGTGLRGLAGMPPRRNSLVRPFLTTSRAEIQAYLDAFHIPHREDESNTDETYSRNRIRAQVMPVLRSLNPRFVQACSTAAASLRLDSDFLETQADHICATAKILPDGLQMDIPSILDLPPALAARVLRRLLERSSGCVTGFSAKHIAALLDLCQNQDPSASLSLPHGLTVKRIYQTLFFTLRTEPLPACETVPLQFHGVTCPKNSRYSCRCRPAICPENPEPGIWYLRLFPDAVLRPRQTGDTLTLPGSKRTLKRRFIDAKIPQEIRHQIPVLADSKGVAAVAGFGPDRARLAKPGETAWAIAFQRIETERNGYHERDERRY